VGADPLVAAECGAIGAEVNDIVQETFFGQSIPTERFGTDVFLGFVGGAASARLFPTIGRLPYKPSNIWNPGKNAGREYYGGLLGGVIGLIPLKLSDSLIC
jgi:hypothetical protein